MTDIKIEGDLGDVGQAISSRYLYGRGYRLAHTGKSLLINLASEFIAVLQLDGYTVCDLREFDGTITAMSPDSALFMRGNIHHFTDIYTNQGQGTLIVAFFNKYKKFFDLSVEDPEMVRVEYYYHHKQSGSRSHTVHIAKNRIQKTIPQLYPDYNVDELVRQYLLSDDSILLLYGPPGVGKTQFIRYILTQGSFDDIVYVKDPKVLEASDFWAEMSGRDVDLMIFDDMDEGLKPRKSHEDTDFTSNLLSFTSGIFEKKTKIIITTNQEISEIDSAIVRPGRCFDFLTLHPLNFRHARVIWTNILGQSPESFDLLYGNQPTITQASLMSDLQRHKNHVTERSYVINGPRNYNVQSKLQNNGVTVK